MWENFSTKEYIIDFGRDWGRDEVRKEAKRAVIIAKHSVGTCYGFTLAQHQAPMKAAHSPSPSTAEQREK